MSRFRDERGVGLVELLVVMVLLGLLTTGLLSVVSATVRAEHVADELSGEIESVRVAMDRLRKEIRSTRQVRVGSTDRLLHLWLDSDQNGNPLSTELISYQLVPTAGGFAELRRWTAAQTQANAMVVARGLTDAPVFAYDPAPTATTLVTVTLTGDSDSSRLSKVITHSTQVRVRNE